MPKSLTLFPFFCTRHIIATYHLFNQATTSAAILVYVWYTIWKRIAIVIEGQLHVLSFSPTNGRMQVH